MSVSVALKALGCSLALAEYTHHERPTTSDYAADISMATHCALGLAERMAVIGDDPVLLPACSTQAAFMSAVKSNAITTLTGYLDVRFRDSYGWFTNMASGSSPVWTSGEVLEYVNAPTNYWLYSPAIRIASSSMGGSILPGFALNDYGWSNLCGIIAAMDYRIPPARWVSVENEVSVSGYDELLVPKTNPCVSSYTIYAPTYIPPVFPVGSISTNVYTTSLPEYYRFIGLVANGQGHDHSYKDQYYYSAYRYEERFPITAHAACDAANYDNGYDRHPSGVNEVQVYTRSSTPFQIDTNAWAIAHFYCNGETSLGADVAVAVATGSVFRAYYRGDAEFLQVNDAWLAVASGAISGFLTASNTIAPESVYENDSFLSAEKGQWNDVVCGPYDYYDFTPPNYINPWCGGYEDFHAADVWTSLTLSQSLESVMVISYDWQY